LCRARSFEQFRQVYAQWPATALNVVYADVSDTIGWQLIGQAPQRRKGWGLLPAAGWDEEAGWEEDPLPFAQMPHLADPEAGFIATANALPTREGEGPFLGVDFLDGYRLARITEALEARHDWDLAGMQALQLDLHSIPWREMRAALLAVPAQTDAAREGLDLLSNWDGVVGADSPAAAVYQFFRVAMVHRLVRAKAPHAADWALGKGATPLRRTSPLSLNRTRHLSRLLREQPAGWFARGWPLEMADALGESVRALRERCGPDRAAWAWGRVRPLTLRHSMGGRAPLDKVFNLGPLPWGGDETTVSACGVNLFGVAGNARGAATMRTVVDVGNWEASRFVLAGGQSGNPLSPHYADQLPLWRRGEGIAIAWTPAEVGRIVQKTLRLAPK
jgi:penicillin amidase